MLEVPLSFVSLFFSLVHEASHQHVWLHHSEPPYRKQVRIAAAQSVKCKSMPQGFLKHITEACFCSVSDVCHKDGLCGLFFFLALLVHNTIHD